ncbi:MAG: undecaprenyl/decaprenyl-phosphate alpha-N-acetylglucosaminyl 1-phosphate transferase [Gammaproteobacteria bacterium]|nr:undecaprenyl/decaprenyl-phosphate alpha-N-acetylglucosaminyl 1-phosphate transferase [Gammaproteobacteria bacterium]
MSITGLISFLIAISLSMMLIPLLVRVAASVGLMDLPGPRKVHADAVPRVGGIAIFLGSVVPLLIWMPKTQLFVALLAALTLLFLFGLWDDRSDLNFRIKFLGQITAASILVYWGDACIHHFPFFEDGEIPQVLAQMFTVILLVGVTNAVNMADGLDGLAGGTSLLAIGCMTVTAYLAQDANMIIFGLALIGATLGFLRFNTYPARIFMGDAGSQMLGFCSGAICILVTQKSNTALSPMMAVMVLGLPLLDVFFVMAIRISEGRSPFAPDKNHIHHRFLDIGFSHREAVYVVYAIQIALVLTAFVQRYASDLQLLVIYLVFCVALLSMIAFAKRRVGSTSKWVKGLQRVLARIGVGSELNSYRSTFYQVVRVMLSAILIIGVSCAADVHSDFGVLAVLLLVLLLPAVLFNNELSHAVRRLCLYVTAGFVVYFMEVEQQHGGVVAIYLPILFLIIGIAVAFLIKIAGSSVRDFSALDFLLLAMALIVSIFPEARVMDGIDAKLVIEIVVLFYAIDVLFNRQARMEKLVLASASISLLVIISRSLL